MPSWPTSLPQQLLGTSNRPQDVVLRGPNDAGPPSRRKRFTARSRYVTVPMYLTGTQLQTFNSFFDTDLDHGALAFDWEDPVTDATVSFAFVTPPEWFLIRGGVPSARVWQASLELEIQP